MIKVRLEGDTDSLKVDESTNALATITYQHHEVHEGCFFRFWSFNADLDDTITIEYLITTGNKQHVAHFTWEVSGALTTLVEFFEGSTHTLGAEQAVFNANRNKLNPPETKVFANAAGGTDGTVIDGASFGIDTGVGTSVRSGGGTGRAGQEWVLNKNTTYLIRATSGADNNNVTIKLSWYENN